MGKLGQKVIRLIYPDSLQNVKILFLREGRSGLREIAFSGRTLYFAGVIALVLVPAFMYLGAQLLLETAHSNRVERIRRDNQGLMAQIDQFDIRIGELERNLVTLSDLDQDLRAHANIPPIPEEIRQIGTGGGAGDIDSDLAYLLPSEGVSIKELGGRVDDLNRALRLEQLSYEDIRDILKDDLARLKNTPSIRPMAQGTYSSGFGFRRHPYNKRPDNHRGLDISAQSGTKVWSTAEGKVVATRFDRNLGLYVKIDHGNGFHTLYGHLYDISVTQGQRIKRGGLLGHSGNTGRTTAPHLHYEVRLYNKPQNPVNYF